jgi:ketosteroid isomerase-like protein
LKGWAAIQSSLEKELRDVTIEANIKIAEIVVTGNWAYARGEYRTIATPRVGGEPTITKGNWFDILNRQTDGTWKITYSTWSD